VPGLDTGQLIEDARHLVAESKEICERSRHAVEKSKRLEEIFAASRPESDQTRRKHPLKH
jgi:hypothetical protein